MLIDNLGGCIPGQLERKRRLAGTHVGTRSGSLHNLLDAFTGDRFANCKAAELA
jgi:hypothetical protein